ncbi:MAG: CIA30 family protein [Planctomycetota bacterium]
MRAALFLLLLLGVPAPDLWAQEQVIIEDFNAPESPALRIKESIEGSVTYALESNPDRGGYLQMTFRRPPNAGFAYVYLPLVEKLSASAAGHDGLSLKVKGDGSTTFGTIEIRSDEYRNIFQAVFPLDSTDWTRIDIRWEDFFQMNDGVPEAPINWAALNVFAFGSRAMWGDGSFAVDDIALAAIEPREPVKAPPGMDELSRFVARLKAGGELKIVALGDSITFGAKVHSGRRTTALYFQRVAAGLERAFPGATVSTVNAGVGGDTIAEAIVRVGHQVVPHDCDLVLVLLGANDAMYAFSEARVRATMTILLDRLLETTRADILLLGPTQVISKPGVPEAYAAIYRDIAREKGVAFLNLSETLSLLAEEDFKRAFADAVHLSEYGHEVISEAVLSHILELARLRPAPPAGLHPGGMEAHSPP